MAIFLGRRMLLAAKIEATEGTAETPAGADANMLVFDPKFDPDIDQFDRQPVAADLSKYASIPGARKGRLTFKAEVKGSGTAGTAPAIGKLLRACGMSETIVAVTSATYKPASVSLPTITFVLQSLPETGNAIQVKLFGAAGTWRCSGRAGEPIMLEFTFSGVYSAVTDVTELVASGVETTLPIVLTNAAFTVQALSAKISGLSMDLGNTIVPRWDVSKTPGIFSYKISGRRPTMQFDSEKELVATHDFYGKILAGTLDTMSVALTGSAGNITTITAPKVQYLKLSEGERDGLAIYTVDCGLNRSVGNDDLSIAFT